VDFTALAGERLRRLESMSAAPKEKLVVHG
jgi:hypothetical protein